LTAYLALCCSAGQRLDPWQDALGSAPMIVNVAVLVVVVTAIAMAAERRPRSGRRRAHHSADHGPDRAAHRSSGHHAPRGPHSLCWRAQPAKARQPSATHMILFIMSRLLVLAMQRTRRPLRLFQTAYDSNGLARTA
jgi:hypothetical protein